MIAQETAATALSTLVSLAGLFWLAYFGFRAYRVDKFRHQLFTLRAELFDLGSKGEIAFDQAAYSQLRGTLNGFLRFADRLSIVSYFLITRDLHRMLESGQAVLVKSEWESNVETLEPGVAVQLRDIRARMHVAVFEQIIFSSPLFVLTLVPFLLKALIRFAGERYLVGLYKTVYVRLEKWFERVVKPLDAFALQVGTAA